MTTSESVNEIAAALAKAQAAMKNATLNKVNPHFKSKFADLASVRDAVIPALTANGVSVVQTLEAPDGNQLVVTRLIHASGQWIESRCPMPTPKNMQEMGSAITYARRYSLSAICGIAADEDDDANGAVNDPTVIVSVPAGFEEWALDLEATAVEGTDALKAAWLKSQPSLRQHMTLTDNARWESMKARAAKVKVPAHA